MVGQREMAKNRYISKLVGWKMGAKRTKYKVRDEGDRARDGRDWGEAIRLYNKHLEALPDDTAAMVQLGHALKENGNLDQAGMMYNRALKGAQFDDDLYLQLGHLEKLRGNLDAARANYRKSYELNGNNVNAEREMSALLEKNTGPLQSPPIVASVPVITLRPKESEGLINELLRDAISKISK